LIATTSNVRLHGTSTGEIDGIAVAAA